MNNLSAVVTPRENTKKRGNSWKKSINFAENINLTITFQR
jgi:hypothetical protein